MLKIFLGKVRLEVYHKAEISMIYDKLPVVTHFKALYGQFYVWR